LLQEIDRILIDIHRPALASFSSDLDQLAIYQSEFEIRAIESIAPATVNLAVPAAAQVIQSLRLNPMSIKGASGGKLLESFLDDYSKAERDLMTGVIRQGFFEGKTTAQIITALVGTKANNYTDGALAISKRNAEAVVRTSVQHSAMQGTMMAFQENESVLNGYQWVSTLDSRTSTICRSLDGVVFKFGKGPVPPAHVNCRSRIVPELDDKYDWLTEGETRSSIDGYVPADQNYYEWLKGQPAGFQDDALGKTRAKLFRDGGIGPNEFARLNLGRNFEPLTLDEMRRKDPLAFKRAGV
jgi:SPP1 gp7 family putative phage head morphogenesis protein